MLSIPGLKDLMRTRDAKREDKVDPVDLFGPMEPLPCGVPSYLLLLASRIGIELLALVEVDEAGKSARIRAAGHMGLSCELTVPRLDCEGVLSKLIADGSPASGKARVFAAGEVFPAGETWCDLIPLDSSVEYVFIPLVSLPTQKQDGGEDAELRGKYLLASRDTSVSVGSGLTLRAGLAASLVALSLAADGRYRKNCTLSVLTKILNEDGYSIGFVDDKGNIGRKYGDGADLITADLVAGLNRHAGNVGSTDGGVRPGPLDISPDASGDLKAKAYPVNAPGAEPQYLVATKQSAQTSQVQTRRERLKLLSRFVSSIAHEIKNPLTGIAAGIQYLARKLQPGLEEDETVEFILSEINRLNRIVDDLYKITRPPELVFQQVCLKEALGRSLICLSEEVTSKRLVVEQDLDASMPDVEADPDRLQQIFINIIKNAVEASPEGGVIRLEIGRADSQAVVRITDSGPGIEREDRERIFEPFYSTKDRGSGLGLCVTQRIVDEHGGNMRIETPPGGGTSFVIEIPIRR